jgi:predicted O-methyltransferase YrrM
MRTVSSIGPKRDALLAASIRSWLRERLNGFRLHRAPRCDVDFSALAQEDQLDVNQILDPQPWEDEWRSVEREISTVVGSDANLAYSANRGDQRALYHFVRQLRPRCVLEIGTCFGVSTLHIAAAMHRNATMAGAKPGRLTTVDIRDVNAPGQPWREYGFTLSPHAMLTAAGLLELVEFVTLDSTTFMANTDRRFDFVYLDGSTAAAGAYRELQSLPDAVECGAIVLLHAYFPDGRPLWAGEPAITGAWRAVGRLRSERANIAGRPLVGLPWPTKGQTRATSLAMIGRAP